MRILRIMLVITLLFANYQSAQAFGDVSHCAKSMMAGGKMMDCCKEKSGKPMKCPCCDGCINIAPAAIMTGFSLDFPSVPATLETPPARALSHLFPTPEFRPPDFLA